MLRSTTFIVMALALSGCGWHKKSESVSPNGVNRVALLQQRVLEMGGGLRIRYIANSKTIYTREVQGDVYLNFIEVLWSKDSSRVGIFIRVMPTRGFAYDFPRRSEIPFDVMKAALADKIREEYHLSDNEDPFNCFKCTEDFIKQHPSEITH